MTTHNLKSWTAALVCTSLLSSGCSFDSQAERGTAIGALYGSFLGALIGNQSGHAGGGAAIGALAGGLTGNAIGEANDERDAALAHAAYVESKNAVTNADLIMMSRNGVSDDVIINSVRTQGGRLDLSPMAIVNLKNSGVSDNVIRGIQEAAETSAAPPPPYPRGGAVQTSFVVIQPQPVVGVGMTFGGPPRPVRRPFRYRHW